MKHYLIYKITNLVNNKIYIGAHQTENINDNYMGSGKYLKRAQQKYGIDKFKKEILFECKSSDEMYQKEAEIVDEEFVARLDTYNLKVGGDGGWDYINKNYDKNKRLDICTKASHIMHDKYPRFNPLDILKKKMSKKEYEEFLLKHALSVSYHWKLLGIGPFSTYHHSEESKKKIGLANSKRQSGSGNSNFGKMWICNDLTHESKSILKTDPIPNGWRKGRFCK